MMEESGDDLPQIRRDLSTLLKKELEVTERGVLEEHSEEFLQRANAQTEFNESGAVVTWSADGYTVRVE